jgi:hypothetical protein
MYTLNIYRSVFIFLVFLSSRFAHAQVDFNKAIICEAVPTSRGIDAQNCKTQFMNSMVNIDYNLMKINMKIGPNRFILNIESIDQLEDGLILHCKDINYNGVDVGIFANGDFMIRTKSHFITLR